MKKLLIATLALITALSISLAACDKGKKDPEPLDDPDDDLVARPSGNGTTTNGDGTTTTGNDGGSTTTVQWVEKNDTVYVLANDVNLRATATTSSKSEGKVNLGTDLARTKEGSNGWSEVKITGDKLVYIKTEYITTNQNDVLFDACEETPITFDSDIYSANLRSDPCLGTGTIATSIDDVKTTPPVITKIAVNKSNTWAKIKYNGKEYYLATHMFDGIASNSPSGLG